MKDDRMFSYEAQNRDASTEECGELCKEYKYFALQFKGQCFCGNNDDYDRHGSSGSCSCESDNVGKYIACVYDTFSQAPVVSPLMSPVASPSKAPTSSPINSPTSSPSSYEYKGCYKDNKSNRMFSKMAQRRGATTIECANLCKGYKYFSRQSKGQCFCGNSDNFDKHGSSSSCKCNSSNVGSYSACVYEIDGQKRRKRRLKTSKGWHLHEPLVKQYYYGYKGGLTMPPCSDNVFWYIISKIQKISNDQLQRLQTLITGYRDESCRYGTYADRDGGVARPLQSAKGSIFECTSRDY